MAYAGTTNPESKDGIIWWNMHVSKENWTEECPDYLASADDADRATLAMYNSDYHCLSWGEVYNLIKTNQLQKFQRWPTDLRRYREYVAHIKQQYGSIVNFMLSVRLRWKDLTPKGGPFEYEDDYKVLLNDWPYGIDPKIKHLVVWVKFAIKEDPVTGDLTQEMRQQIDDFVRRTFIKGENTKDVAWFRNWAALKSVHAVEHFHVMLHDPDPELVRTVTDGDVATADLMKQNENAKVV